MIHNGRPERVFMIRTPEADRKQGVRRIPLFAVVACLGFAAVLIADWPGHFAPDSVWQLAQGRSGVYNGWHPPVMAWLLGIADRIVPGAPLFFVLDTALFFGALAALMALRPRPNLLGAAVLALLAASPLVLIYQGLVLKDVLFADVAVAGFAALAWAGRLWAYRLARIALIAIALMLLTLALLARQNGMVAALGGALTLGAIAAAGGRSGGGGRAALRFLAAAVIILVVMGAVGGAATLALATRSDRSPEAHHELSTLEVYDLVGAVHRDPGFPMPVLHRQAPAFELFLRHDAVKVYDPARMDPIARIPGWDDMIVAPGPGLGAQWRQLITASPLLYLRVRAEVFRQVFMTPNVRACAPVLTGVDGGDQDMLRAAGLKARESDKDDWDSDYGQAFLGTPAFSHVFYAVIAVILLILAVRDLRRGGPPDRIAPLIAVIGLLGSALVFAASFFPISIACDYRYLYFLDAATMAGLAHRAAGWRLPWRPRPQTPLHAGAKEGMD